VCGARACSPCSYIIYAPRRPRAPHWLRRQKFAQTRSARPARPPLLSSSCPNPQSGLAPRAGCGGRGRLQRARSAPHARRCCSSHVLRRRRGLAPRVGGGRCWGRGRPRCFPRLHFCVRRRGPAAHFVRGRFIDQGRFASLLSDLRRRPFAMPLPIHEATCQWWGFAPRSPLQTRQELRRARGLNVGLLRRKAVARLTVAP
jgi:hypothetical protein